jgi:hypothetical protein
MLMHATHDSEARRLDVLAELDILDTPRELAFDRLTTLCRKMFRVQMSTLTLIDGHRQWFKASEGMEHRETARGPALCNYAIAQDDPLVVKISFNAGQSTIDCTVRGLSRDTATIEVISASDIPEQFKLAIASDALSRVCHVTAKADTRIEVAFT